MVDLKQIKDKIQIASISNDYESCNKTYGYVMYTIDHQTQLRYFLIGDVRCVIDFGNQLLYRVNKRYEIDTLGMRLDEYYYHLLVQAYNNHSSDYRMFMEVYSKTIKEVYKAHGLL